MKNHVVPGIPAAPLLLRTLLYVAAGGFALFTSSTAFAQAEVRQLRGVESGAYVSQGRASGQSSAYVGQLPRGSRLRPVRTARRAAPAARRFNQNLIVGQPAEPTIVPARPPQRVAASTPRVVAKALPSTHGGVIAELNPTGATPRLPSVGRGLAAPVTN